MTPTPIPDPSDRRSAAASGVEPPSSFENLLEHLLAISHSDLATAAVRRRTLDMIAAYFAADRAVLSLHGKTDPGGDDMPPGSAEAPDLEVPIAVAGGEPIGTVALHAPDRTSPWTDRDRDRLRLAAWTLSWKLQAHQIESELREQGIWLLMAMESATVGVWDWDLDTDRVRYVSPFGARGGPPRVQEVEASSWFETTHAEDVKLSRPEVDRAISGETDAFSMVVRQRAGPDPDERWRRIYSRGRVIERDASGRARRLMGTFEDVTEAQLKVQAEKEHEAAMARSARMASLGAFASSLAHDLNQPLTALTSFLEGSVRLISKGEASDADVMEAVERSVAFAHRASDIVRRFRQILQREAPLWEPIDVGSLLLEVRENVYREAVAADVEIVVPDRLGQVVVRGDALQIEQVLVNLVRNAVEALDGTDRRPRTVALGVSEATDWVELRVSDNGPGIPNGVPGHLFEPLATSKEAGRGLGLAICHSIAEIHGGRLAVERTGPDGTTFVLALPRDDGGGP